MKMKAPSQLGSLGERVALCKVAVSAVLADLLAEVTVTQTYRNEENTNIEAVFTFPMPVDAVLLSMDVALGGRRLRGVVVEKSEAEEQYEEAIEEGDAAVMLENPEPGLYTMNAGNLLPGETAIVTVRHALLHRWNGDSLRFHLPTTIAPRYGKSPLAPHQAPEHSLSVENQFSIDIEVAGALRNAQFDCPTHPVRLSRADGKLKLALAGPLAAMDRDFVLNVRMPVGERNFVMTGQDGDSIAAIASFQPFFPGLRSSTPLDLIIVLDCSGSMAGDSIAQAKLALDGILGRLREGDKFDVIAFGSDTRTFSPTMLPCTPDNLDAARRLVGSLDADMGGTEIENALRAARNVSRRALRPDIFLITDGEVADWQPVVDRARKGGNRVFTVGVGSAVSEAFVRKLASATGGECELVTTNEGMADRVVRHFERMRAPRAKRAEIRWPRGAADVHPSVLGSVFAGDTVTASARFDRMREGGEVVLEIEFADGDISRQSLSLPESQVQVQPGTAGMSTVARVAAAARMASQDGATALATALRYQLVSPLTHCLVVAERAQGDKATDLPVLRKVPQTMVAGSAGGGPLEYFFAPASHATHDIDRIARFVDQDFGAMPVGAAPGSARGGNRVLTYQDVRVLVTGVGSRPFDMQDLVDQVADDPEIVSVATAFEILYRAGFLALFADVWTQAEASGVEFSDAAAIVVDRLLRSRAAQGALDLHAERAVLVLAGDVEALVRRIGSDLAEQLRRLTYQAVQNASAVRDTQGSA
jgi:Ca-activated chloride channel family protein